MSEEVMHLAVGQSTSRQLCLAIEGSLGSSTRARTLHLVGQLQVLRQGNSSIDDYLGRAQMLIEDLALANHPVGLDDQNLYIFRGLRSEYRPLFATLTKGEQASLTELSNFLISQDFICDDGDLVSPSTLAVRRGGRSGGGQFVSQ